MISLTKPVLLLTLFAGTTLLANSIDFTQIIVGDEVATYLEVEETKQVAQSQIARSNLPAEEKRKQLARIEQTVVENLVQGLLLLNRANQLKLTVSDQQIETRMERLAENNPRFLEQMQTENDDAAEIREKIAQELLKEQVLAREVNASLQVSTSDALQLCLQESEFQKKIDLYQILLRTTSAQKVAQIRQAMLLQLAQGRNIESLAKQFSQAPSVQRDAGLVADLQRGQIIPALDQVAFTLKEKQLSPPIQTQYGYHLLYVSKITKREASECQQFTQGTSNRYYFQAFRTQQSQFLKEQYFPKLRREFDISCFQLQTLGQKCLPLQNKK